jgi:hypothetical protein
MIPSAPVVADAYRFVARRYGVASHPDLPAIESALRDATALAVEPADEPAALFAERMRPRRS